jgi:hypothetical protein
VLGVLLAVLLLCGCTQQAQPTASAGPGRTLWPTTASQVALVTQGGSYALTDGRVIAPVPLGRAEAGTDVAVAPMGKQSLAVLVEGRQQQLAVVDLRTGTTVHRACVGCSGLAVLGSRVVTVIPDGTLVTLDSNLGGARTVLLADVGPSTSPGFLPDPDWAPYFRVLGATGDTVLVARLAPDGGVRGGPTLVSAHRLDGGKSAEARLDGRSGVARTDASARHVALFSAGSSGACASGGALQGLDGALLFGTFEDVFEDWSWAGESLITVTYRNLGFVNGANCQDEPRTVRQLNPDGSVVAEQPSPGIVALRVLGSCDRVLGLRSLPGQQPVLLVSSGGAARVLGQVDALLWSSPASAMCPSLQNTVGALARA